MTIFNLPEEPNSPAGQAIQTAQAVPNVVPDKFIFILKSDIHLGDTVSEIEMNLATKEITFNATETPDFAWTDWLLAVPEDESVSLFLVDEAGQQRFNMIMEGIYVFDHHCTLFNSHLTMFGIDSPSDSLLQHKITVQFTNIQRLPSNPDQPQGMPEMAFISEKPSKKYKEKLERKTIDPDGFASGIDES